MWLINITFSFSSLFSPLSPLFLLSFPSSFPLSFLSFSFLPPSLAASVHILSQSREKNNRLWRRQFKHFFPDKTLVLIFFQGWGMNSHLLPAEVWLGSCMHRSCLGGNQRWQNSQVWLLTINSALTKSLQSQNTWEMASVLSPCSKLLVLMDPGDFVEEGGLSGCHTGVCCQC